MPLGYELATRVVNLNDTAVLVATLYGPDDKLVPASELATVDFVIQAPDGTKATASGTIQADGSGTADFSSTSQIGHYAVVATFTDTTGRRTSVRADFEVSDPFTTSPNLSASYLVATQIWSRIEDCFDAEEEGPWLRDMTLNVFNKEKMESFLDLALFDLNNLNPPTNLTLANFVYTDPVTKEVSSTADLPLIVQGGFLVCLRHLMTSYVEQPLPSGAATQVGWQDRRDYLTRWAAIYQVEFTQYDRMAKLYKRRFLGLGITKGLLSSKAGRLIPAPMRSRMIGRGMW